MRKRTAWGGVLVACCWGQIAGAAALSLLSTGAVEPGIKVAAERFYQATGDEFSIIYRTAPEVREQLREPEGWDLAIATPATIEEHTRTGLFAAGSVNLGKVGVGIAVRQGTPLPDITNEEAVKRAVLTAEKVVFSRGSTGQYAESLLKKWGVYAKIEPRIVRVDRGTDAMERLKQGTGGEMAFGALTEIALHTDSGVVLVGPLPDDIQYYTAYAIARLAKAKNARNAAAFLEYLKGPESRADFRAVGIYD